MTNFTKRESTSSLRQKAQTRGQSYRKSSHLLDFVKWRSRYPKTQLSLVAGLEVGGRVSWGAIFHLCGRGRWRRPPSSADMSRARFACTAKSRPAGARPLLRTLILSVGNGRLRGLKEASVEPT
eukprot:1193534-Prorocentrum_minimum.AAC.2